MPLIELTKRVQNFTHHAHRHHFFIFFVIAVDAPGQAQGRDTATFSGKKTRALAYTLQNGPFPAFFSSAAHRIDKTE